jgi:hypothetical protein
MSNEQHQYDEEVQLDIPTIRAKGSAQAITAVGSDRKSIEGKRYIADVADVSAAQSTQRSSSEDVYSSNS